MPRPDAPLDEIARLERMFPATAADGQPLIAPSNACAAIRRSAWEQARFDETIAAAEERPWMQAMSRLGYRCVYVPSARVLHSHRDPLFRFALRLIELEARTRGRQNAWLRIHELVHCAAALVKRRVVNLAITQAQWRVRIEALMRLPCEIGVIFFLGILGRNARLWHLLRGPAWG
jgi:GT2 family glycosyltransferase